MAMKWKKLGRILDAVPDVSWLASLAGPAFARPLGSNQLEVFISGRDTNNVTRIGRAVFTVGEKVSIESIDDEALLDIGELGAFDENGVSYPWIIEKDESEYLYYVGWMPTVKTPFQNHLGLAQRKKGNGQFTRVSRAPILARTDADWASIGSCCVLKDKIHWRMWYTSFQRWGQPGEHKHYYHIKMATSDDGIHWQRDNHVAIDFKDQGEYAIGKPCVVHWQGQYHMWYSTRGEQYRIGYAQSQDGLTWIRKDEEVGIDLSGSGWDSQSQCYAQVFEFKNTLYMIYNGNDYGRGGLGLAVLE
ncbi:MAG: hypothetical protein R2827_16270 [Bdellovibrionales bacterium]